MSNRHISYAQTDAEILGCFPVMHALRPHLSEGSFVETVRRMEQQGFRLVFLADPEVKAVAGVRAMESLAMGKTLYVDDLVTDPRHRSEGHGAALLAFLEGEANRLGCHYLELDSGSKRLDAHRFYRRHGLEEIALHFSKPLGDAKKWSEAGLSG